MLLGVLKGLVVALSSASVVVLLAAIIEERVQRHMSRAARYTVAIDVLRRLAWLGLLVCVVSTANYVYRFDSGLPGSILPGPQTNTLLSLGSLCVSYASYVALGVGLFWLMHVAEEPDEEELQQRRREARVRADAERKRAEARHGARGGDREGGGHRGVG